MFQLIAINHYVQLLSFAYGCIPLERTNVAKVQSNDHQRQKVISFTVIDTDIKIKQRSDFIVYLVKLEFSEKSRLKRVVLIMYIPFLIVISIKHI